LTLWLSADPQSASVRSRGAGATPDGAWFVGSATCGSDLVSPVAAAVRGGGRTVAAGQAAAPRTRRMLLALDNCDVIDAAAQCASGCS
jgi:hypothetical protein